MGNEVGRNMWRVRSFALLAFSATALASGCRNQVSEDKANPRGAARSNTPQPTPRLSTITIDAMKIKKALDGDSKLKGAIGVSVNGRTVSLRGTVAETAARKKAEAIARRAAPGYQVFNFITVRSSA